MTPVKKVTTAIAFVMLLAPSACTPRGGTNPNADMNTPEYQQGTTDSTGTHRGNPNNPANGPADTFISPDSIPYSNTNRP